MGFRFQRRVTLFPGVRLNFSKSGVSASVGPRGASMTFGRRGRTVNVGIPGTGISYRQRVSTSSRSSPRTGRSSPAPASRGVRPSSPSPLAETRPPATAIESAPVEEISSDGLATLRELILEARAAREALWPQVLLAEEAVERAQRRTRRAKSWLLRFFYKKRLPAIEADAAERGATLQELRALLDGSFVDADLSLDDSCRAAYEELTVAFHELTSSSRIWDITGTRAKDQRRSRSAAKVSIDRRPVQFTLLPGGEDVLQTETAALRLQNANGADLTLYPGFISMREGSSLGLIDLRELDFEFSTIRFVEVEAIPSDATVVDHAWAKSNRDGSPDRRFKENYQIPVAEYGRLSLSTSAGLNEAYLVSDAQKAEQFAKSFVRFREALEKLSDSS